jgi:hemoglobin
MILNQLSWCGKTIGFTFVKSSIKQLVNIFLIFKLVIKTKQTIMKKLLTLVLLSFIGLLSVQLYAQQAPKESTGSLFQRLGGKEGISAIVDDVVEAHMVNPEIKDRFLPFKGTPELEIAKEHLTEFFISGSGGPAEYTGRDLKTVHAGMQITHKEYMAATDDAMAVLSKHSIDEETQKDVLAIFWSLKDMIIEQ